MKNHDQLLRLIAQHAYQSGTFTLSSGRESHFYLDAKQVTYRPAGARLVGEAVLDLARKYGADAVGGPTMGADAIVASTVVVSENSDRPVHGFIVRKEPKKHGLGKWIEGVDPGGSKVVIVDDVITSGSSVLTAVEKARAAGANVVCVVGLVDRQQGGAEKIREFGVTFEALCTISEVEEYLATASAEMPA